MPTVYWRQQGDNHILGTQASLHLSIVSEKQFTTYTCSAASVGYGTVSRDVHVLHKGPATFASRTEQSARYGDTGEVECLVHSIPIPEHISWMKNGRSMNFADFPRYRLHEEPVPYGIRSAIQISAVQDSDFAEYNCSAYNAYGTRHQSIVFSKKEVIPLLYILAGVGAGVLIIIIVTITVIVCHRRRSHITSESNSHSSDDSVDLKKSSQIAPDIKIEYSTNTVDDWRQDLLVPPRYVSPNPVHADYDELRYPLKDAVLANPCYDAPDYTMSGGYGSYRPRSAVPAMHPVADSLYGTYPRGISYAHEPRDVNNYGPVYGSDTYASVTRPRRNYYPPPPADLRPPMSISPTLSTNV
jgi:hypothetical protein